MKILLTEDVDTLGYKGEIFTVSDGYGRNFLIPQGFAVPATPGQLKQAENWRDQAAARRDQLRKEYEALVGRLSDTQIEFKVKAGDKGRLYGSITTAEIAAKIEETLGIELDRRKITVPGKALREIGTHVALVRLDAEFVANVMISVLDEAALAAAAKKAKAEEIAQAAEVEEKAAAEDLEVEEEIDEEEETEDDFFDLADEYTDG